MPEGDENPAWVFRSPGTDGLRTKTTAQLWLSPYQWKNEQTRSLYYRNSVRVRLEAAKHGSTRIGPALGSESQTQTDPESGVSRSDWIIRAKSGRGRF
jgi:hypothetical protein